MDERKLPQKKTSTDLERLGTNQDFLDFVVRKILDKRFPERQKAMAKVIADAKESKGKTLAFPPPPTGYNELASQLMALRSLGDIKKFCEITPGLASSYLTTEELEQAGEKLLDYSLFFDQVEREANTPGHRTAQIMEDIDQLFPDREDEDSGIDFTELKKDQKLYEQFLFHYIRAIQNRVILMNNVSNFNIVISFLLNDEITENDSTKKKIQEDIRALREELRACTSINKIKDFCEKRNPKLNFPSEEDLKKLQKTVLDAVTDGSATGNNLVN
jgi:hypothetical protein